MSIMKRQLFLLFAFCLIGIKTMAQGGNATYHLATEQLQVDVVFYAPDIVRVVKWPLQEAAPVKKSYSVTMEPSASMKEKVDIRERGEHVFLTSGNLSVDIEKSTGKVTFRNLQDVVLLQEDDASFEARHGDADEGKLRVAQQWKVGDAELIYGLGQLRDEAMNWNHRTIDIWNHNTYISIPYVTSEKGYGLYWDNAGRSTFSRNDAEMKFSSEVGVCSDYYFMYKDGTQDGVIAAIRTLTGDATMFPLWTMGYWQCRERYKTSDELCEVLDNYRKLRIPLDGIVQDWQYWGCDSNWNAMSFMNPYYINKVGDSKWAKYLPDDLKPLAAKYVAEGRQPRIKSPKAMVEYVHNNNAHLMISIWASFGPWTKAYEKLKKINALLPFDTWPRNRGVMPYDPFNPQARDIYWHFLSNLHSLGFDAWWTDSTEPDHFEHEGDDNVMTYDGTWRSVKNAFPLMSNKGIYEHQRALKGNGKRSVQMTRSGTFGIQHYGTFSWSGDIEASWKEMKNQIPSGLNYSLCGIPFWNTDLGGFFYWGYHNNPKDPALQELHTRWMQWGTFMPLMRNHCSSPMVSELYEFGKEGDWCYDVMKRFICLRYRLLPYIYSMAGETVQHAGTMMRPFVMDFPHDREALQLNEEYMFGRSLLVKPVTDPLFTWQDDYNNGHYICPGIDPREIKAPVSVYLPKGCDWYDFWTGERIQGGKRVKRVCPIDVMPVYVKSGSILPMGPFVQYSSEKAWDDMEIRLYPGADGHFTLYEDEGDGYGYEQGHFTEIVFSWDEANRVLTIDDRKGTFQGMLQKRKFKIIVGAKGDGEPSTYDKTVEYEGRKIKVQL